MGFVDGALVVGNGGGAASGVDGGKHAAPAQAGDLQAGIANGAGGAFDAHGLQHVAPGRDGRDGVAGAAFDAGGQIPLAFDGDGVERGGGGRGHQAMPFVVSRARMRATARSGSRSRPALSARRNNSAKWLMERADCWPPSMVKWFWWPFSQAMNTTPVL